MPYDFNYCFSIQVVPSKSTNALDRWPPMLKRIQALCNFFRNWEYRSCLRQHLISRFEFAKGELLLNFSASFIHWRYETVADVFSSLVKLRDICENDFDPKILGDVQEETLIADVDAACKDPPLWRSGFSAVYFVCHVIA